MRLFSGMIILFSQMSFADATYRGEIGIDYWWGSTKINGVRYDEDSAPSMTIALQNTLPYVPHFKFRYSAIEADYTAFDKYDYTLYYDVLKRDELELNLGFTISDYKNSHYILPPKKISQGFDITTWSFYADGAVGIPGTNLDIIGQFDFYSSAGESTSDFIAGLEYTFDYTSMDIALKGGYRVMDYIFDGQEYQNGNVFIDGWFLGFLIKI